MTKILTLLAITIIFTNCQPVQQKPKNIATSDIANFWEAYDKITSTQDSILQYKYLDNIYFQKGTAGLKAIRQARNYTAQNYITAINNYPKFWTSVRENTLKADQFRPKLEKGIEKLRELYPDLKPAKIYFTIGALRTNGTTLDSLVLIGSELAMTDKNTISSEFPEENRDNRRNFFDSNPINDLVLLNIHEFVHTQQKPIVHNLLSYCIYEGVAEFVSVKALNTKSATPAIEYGKKNDKVRKKFEQEMFYGNNVNQWLWSDAENDFAVRDLGYYIGYQICELYYKQAKDKKAAIKKMIELDYTNETEIENFVNGTGFFSKSLEELYQEFETKRPRIIGIKPIENNGKNIDPKINQITIEFSEPMNKNFTNFNYGPLGENNSIRIKNIVGYSDNAKSLTFEIEDLEPNKQYQLTIGSGFRNLKNVPLKPYLINFKTGTE